MKRIFKYELDYEIGMPKGAKILTVQTQLGVPHLWALVDLEEDFEVRKISVYGTGHAVPDDPGEYIGTYQECGGSLIFHVFERR